MKDNIKLKLGNIILAVSCLVFVYRFGFTGSLPKAASLHQISENAQNYLDNDEPDKAIVEFNKILLKNPNSEDILLGKAEAFEMLEQWDSASAQYKKLNGIKPFDYAVLTKWNRILSQTDEKGTQLLVLEHLFSQNNCDLNHAIQLLKAYESAGIKASSPKYVMLLEKIHLIPNSAEFLADKLGRAQNKELAKSNHKKELRDSEYAVFWRKIKSILEWRKISLDTLSFQQKLNGFIFRYPEVEKFKEAQAILYYVQEQYDYARPLVKHLGKKNLNGIRLRGNLYFINEQFRSAANQLGKIPKDKITQEEWERLCDALLSINQSQKANNELKYLLKRYPQSKLALSFLTGNKP